MKHMKKSIWIIILSLLSSLGLSGCKESYELSVPEEINNNIIWAIPPTYVVGKEFIDGVALVKDDNRIYFIHKDGSIFLDDIDDVKLRYQGSSGFFHGIIIAKPKGNEEPTYLYRNGNSMEEPCSNTTLVVINHDSLSLAEEDGKYGILNLQKLWVIPPIYSYGYNFVNGYAVLIDDPNRQKYIVNENLEFIAINNQYSISDINENLASANSQKYISLESGEVVISGPFEDTTSFSEGLAAVRKNGAWGYINAAGETVIPFVYNAAQPFSSGLARVNSDFNYYFINHEGEVILDCAEKNVVGEFHDDTAIVKVSGQKYNIIDIYGEALLPKGYPSIQWSNYGWYQIVQKGKFGLYNAQTQTLIEPLYDNLCLISDEIAVIEVDYKIGLINIMSGEVLLQPCLEWNELWGEGLIVVRNPQTSLYGYIDYHGNWVIPPIFDDARRFSGGLASVTYNGKVGYIANPLIYETWTEDELQRAMELGLTVSKEYGQTISNLAFWENLCQTMLMKDDILFPLPGAEDESLTRASAALFIHEYVKALGVNNDHFLSAFSDIDELDFVYYNAISYAASIGVFNLDLSGQFFPYETLNERDACCLIVRLYEYLLDIDSIVHPERGKLTIAFLG